MSTALIGALESPTAWCTDHVVVIVVGILAAEVTLVFALRFGFAFGFGFGLNFGS